jgi:hypothetical protein
MTSALAALSRDPQAWEPVSRRCQHYMSRQFNEQQMVEPYLAALSSLYAMPRASSTARQEF